MTRERFRKSLPLALFLLLSCVQGGLLARTAWVSSHTWDEGMHAVTARVLWFHGDTEPNCEAVVFPKWAWGAAASIVSDPNWASASYTRQTRHAVLEQAFNHYLNMKPDEFRRHLFAVRLATMAAILLGGFFLWLAGRRFGPVSAAVAHALWVFSPSILAHGALVTHDGWAAAVAAFLTWSAVRFFERPSFGRAAVIGLALGLGAATKLTLLITIPIVAVVGLFAIWRARDQTRRVWAVVATRVGACTAAGVLTLWALYRFDVGRLDADNVCLSGPYAHLDPDFVAEPVPFPDWLAGVAFRMGSQRHGHPTFLAGETSATGFRHFYLVVLAIKTTAAALLLAILCLVVQAVSPRRRHLALVTAGLLAFPIVLFLSATFSHVQLGIRYLLPAFPLVFLWLGVMVDAARRVWRPAFYTGLGLVTLAAVESVAAHPHHLAFFNVFVGGAENGLRLRNDSDADWGQDLYRLGEWQTAAGIEEIFYVPYVPWGHWLWNVHSKEPGCEPAVGTYALAAGRVVPGYRAGCLDWLTIEPPDLRIGATIYVYRVDERRLERLAEKRRAGHSPWLSDPTPCRPPSVRDECDWAEAGGQRWLLCTGVTDWASAARSCESHGLRLARRDDEDQGIALAHETVARCGFGEVWWLGGPSTFDPMPDAPPAPGEAVCFATDFDAYGVAFPTGCAEPHPYVCRK